MISPISVHSWRREPQTDQTVKKKRNLLHDAVVVRGDVGTGAELQGALFGHLQDNKSKGQMYKVHTGRLK